MHQKDHNRRHTLYRHLGHFPEGDQRLNGPPSHTVLYEILPQGISEDAAQREIDKAHHSDSSKRVRAVNMLRIHESTCLVALNDIARDSLAECKQSLEFMYDQSGELSI